MPGKKIKLSEAQKMVRNYNSACKADDVHSLKIDAKFLQKIIGQKDCEYVRFFLAIDGEVAKGKVGLAPGHTLVVIGVNKAGKNIKFGERDTEVYENLGKCPVMCDDGEGYNL